MWQQAVLLGWTKQHTHTGNACKLPKWHRLQCGQQQGGADLINSKAHGSICCPKAPCLLNVLLFQSL